ncbi:hypothetical protein C2E23DRAFT_540062 [Lenzites betulinus]|nr:hypothetical protein C2E23DRAFT_540062 [Lenzites betulinus]
MGRKPRPFFIVKGIFLTSCTPLHIRSRSHRYRGALSRRALTHPVFTRRTHGEPALLRMNPFLPDLNLPETSRLPQSHAAPGSTSSNAHIYIAAKFIPAAFYRVTGPAHLDLRGCSLRWPCTCSPHHARLGRPITTHACPETPSFSDSQHHPHHGQRLDFRLIRAPSMAPFSPEAWRRPCGRFHAHGLWGAAFHACRARSPPRLSLERLLWVPGYAPPWRPVTRQDALREHGLGRLG